VAHIAMVLPSCFHAAEASAEPDCIVCTSRGGLTMRWQLRGNSCCISKCFSLGPVPANDVEARPCAGGGALQRALRLRAATAVHSAGRAAVPAAAIRLQGVHAAARRLMHFRL